MVIIYGLIKNNFALLRGDDHQSWKVRGKNVFILFSLMVKKKFYWSYFLRRKYYTQSKNQHAIEHVRQYYALERRLGPIIGDIKKIFLNLHKESFEDLLIPYEKLYGTKARDYAAMAFPKWKSGQTKMSGQTAERILNLVPKYLTTNQRYDIVKKLCEHHIEKKYKHVTIDINNPEIGFRAFQENILEFQDSSFIKHLPEHVVETATWLNDDDVTVTRILLAEINKKISAEVKSYAKIEFNKLHTAINNKLIKEGSQSINFPNGTLTVSFYKPSKCFVASAAFDSSGAYPVIFLRFFRDNYLSNKIWGEKFIDWYYINGEGIASFIKDKPLTRLFVKTILIMLIFVISKFYPFQHKNNEQ